MIVQYAVMNEVQFYLHYKNEFNRPIVTSIYIVRNMKYKDN